MLFELLAGEAGMIGDGRAGFTLFRSTVSLRTDKPVFSIMDHVCLGQSLSTFVLLRSITRVARNELIFALAFHTFHNIHHEPDGLVLHLHELLLAEQTLHRTSSTFN